VCVTCERVQRITLTPERERFLFTLFLLLPSGTAGDMGTLFPFAFVLDYLVVLLDINRLLPIRQE
jgi:hypothetical protein